MRIDFLKGYPAYVQALAKGMATHWANILPQENYESRLRKLNTHLNERRIPLAWVAHDGLQVFGTSALRVNDLDAREDLSPWLAGVFVLPEFRRQGVASKLCIHAEKSAWEMGINTLYLHTPDQERFYHERGWQLLGAEQWYGTQTQIMFKSRIITH